VAHAAGQRGIWSRDQELLAERSCFDVAPLLTQGDDRQPDSFLRENAGRKACGVSLQELQRLDWLAIAQRL
jgi:hypothetical protein